MGIQDTLPKEKKKYEMNKESVKTQNLHFIHIDRDSCKRLQGNMLVCILQTDDLIVLIRTCLNIKECCELVVRLPTLFPVYGFQQRPLCKSRLLEGNIRHSPIVLTQKGKNIYTSLIVVIIHIPYYCLVGITVSGGYYNEKYCILRRYQ